MPRSDNSLVRYIDVELSFWKLKSTLLSILNTIKNKTLLQVMYLL